MESISLTLPKKPVTACMMSMGVHWVYYESKSLFGLCGCRDDHKTQSMIVKVVHGVFGGAMARFRKAGGEVEKWEEQHEKS